MSIMDIVATNALEGVELDSLFVENLESSNNAQSMLVMVSSEY